MLLCTVDQEQTDHWCTSTAPVVGLTSSVRVLPGETITDSGDVRLVLTWLEEVLGQCDYGLVLLFGLVTVIFICIYSRSVSHESLPEQSGLQNL